MSSETSRRCSLPQTIKNIASKIRGIRNPRHSAPDHGKCYDNKSDAKVILAFLAIGPRLAPKKCCVTAN